MDCRDIARMINAFWDRELSPDQSARIRAHLGQCPACHAAYGILDEQLSSPEPVSVPVGLNDRVLAAVLAATRTSSVAVLEKGINHAVHIAGRSASEASPLAPDSPPGLVSRRYRLIPLTWAGALAACIAVLLVGRPPASQRLDLAATSPKRSVEMPSPAALPSLLLAAMQPAPFSLAGAAAVQAAAIDQVTRAQVSIPSSNLHRRPLREDYIPLESTPPAQHLPAVITAFSTLGA